MDFFLFLKKWIATINYDPNKGIYENNKGLL